MSSRERFLLIVVLTLVGGLVLIGGAWAFVHGRGVLRQIDDDEIRLEAEIAAAKKREAALAKMKKRHDYWMAIALPADKASSERYEERFLRDTIRTTHKDLLEQHWKTVADKRDAKDPYDVKATEISTNATLGRSGNRKNVKPIGKFAYEVKITGTTLLQLMNFLHEFYRTNLPHTIRSLRIQAPEAGGRDTPLDVVMKIEVLTLPVAEVRRGPLPPGHIAPRETLVAADAGKHLVADSLMQLLGAPGLSTATWQLFHPTGIHAAHKLAAEHDPENPKARPDRDYTAAAVADRNIFAGLVLRDPPKRVWEDVLAAALSAGKFPHRVSEDALAAALEAGKFPKIPPPPDRAILATIRLTHVSVSEQEATLVYLQKSDRSDNLNKFVSLGTQGSKADFVITDWDDKVVLKGTVKMITDRDVVFVVTSLHGEKDGERGDKLYVLHAGNYLEQAIQREMTAEERKAFGLENVAGPQKPDD